MSWLPSSHQSMPAAGFAPFQQDMFAPSKCCHPGQGPSGLGHNYASDPPHYGPEAIPCLDRMSLPFLVGLSAFPAVFGLVLRPGKGRLSQTMCWWAGAGSFWAGCWTQEEGNPSHHSPSANTIPLALAADPRRGGETARPSGEEQTSCGQMPEPPPRADGPASSSE